MINLKEKKKDCTDVQLFEVDLFKRYLKLRFTVLTLKGQITSRKKKKRNSLPFVQLAKKKRKVKIFSLLDHKSNKKRVKKTINE